MWTRLKIATKNYLEYLFRLSFTNKILALSIILLTLMYPGQNYFQTLIVKPGPIRSYHIPDLPVTYYPVNDGTSVPSLTARAIVIQDAESKTLLYSKHPDSQMLPASTTKIMTALVALDYYHLDQQLTVRNEDRAVGSTMELVKGEVITVESLLYGLLVDSGNDAALTLAENLPGGYEAFVAAMNAKARAYHLDSTTYRNVSGVESYGHFTTARDLAILASIAVNNPVINRIMQTKNITITDVSGEIVHQLVSTNELLGEVPGLMGLKTGWTQNAGECLVSYLERDGRRVVIVILGSADRFGETKQLVDWVYSHHTWQAIK